MKSKYILNIVKGASELFEDDKPCLIAVKWNMERDRGIEPL